MSLLETIKESPFPTQLPVEICKDPKNFESYLEKGVVAKIPSATSFLVDHNLSQWKTKFGDVPIRIHSIGPEFKGKACRDIDDVTCEKDVLDLISRLRTQVVPEVLPLAQLVDRMARIKDNFETRAPWDRIPSKDELRHWLERYTAYGVSNVLNFPNLNDIPFSANSWRETFAFLWFGASTGGLHYDELDNVLVQLHGTKSVIIYSPFVRDAVDGNHYTTFNSTRFLTDSVLQDFPQLSHVPFTIVDLKPGDAVVIPAFAYHGPFASSYDSISLNSFFCPDPLRGPFPRLGKLDPFIYWNFISIRQMYPLTKKAWLAGPYEFF